MREDVLRDAPGHHRERVVVRRHMRHGDGPHHGAPAGYTRIDRGIHVPGFCMVPRFLIRDYARYGFYQPMYGGRWIRYYDDALLVDPHGQVIDGEWGLNWDEYGPDWRHGERGIPEYAGADEYYPEDHGYPEDAGHGGYGQSGYVYHYPQAGAIVITETVTTTPGTVEEKVWYEDVPVHHAPRRHKGKARGRK